MNNRKQQINGKNGYLAPEIFIVEYETEEGFALSISDEMNIDLYGFGEMTTAGSSDAERGSWDGGFEGDGWD